MEGPYGIMAVVVDREVIGRVKEVVAGAEVVREALHTAESLLSSSEQFTVRVGQV